MINIKKILFILPWLAVGGLERVQVTIANALAERGHDITIMTYTKGNDLAPELNPRIHFIYKQPKPFPIRRRMKYIWTFYDDGMWETRASPKTLYKYYVGDEKYDVEIAFFRGMSVKIICGSTNNDSIKIAWVHSDYKMCGGYAYQFQSMKHVRAAYMKFNYIVCVSKQAAQSFIYVIGEHKHITTIYNMLPHANIREKAKEITEHIKSKFTVIAVGHLVNVKGFDRLLEASKCLMNENVDFELQIMGEGGERVHLEEYIKTNKLNNVVLLGQQMNPYKYIVQADLLVCSSRYEGYNLTVAEALILSVPVLSTNCTGPSEILDNGKYGYLCENSTDGITEGLRKMIIDKELYTHYKRMVTERQDFFDEKKIISQIEALF